MINKVILEGRLTKDIELRKTNSGKNVAGYTLAVDYGKNSAGEKNTLFMDCVTWEASAEYLYKYAKKGSMISVVGHLVKRSYDGQNGKVWVTEVVTEQVNILASPGDREQRPQNTPETPRFDTGAYNAVTEEELPF